MLIKDNRLKQALLKALGDEPSACILAATAYRPRSVKELILEEKLPSSSAYRRIGELEKAGLVVATRTVQNPDGKVYKMYKATFREVNVKFHAGEVVITAVPNLDAVQKAFRLFHSFMEEE